MQAATANAKDEGFIFTIIIDYKYHTLFLLILDAKTGKEIAHCKALYT